MTDRAGGPFGLGVIGTALLATWALFGSRNAPAPPAAVVVPAAASQRGGAPNAAPRPDRPFDRGTRLVAEFFGDSLPAAGDTTPPAGLGDTANAVDFDVVVATLPDPFDSHLDYTYDTHLEAIQLAFSDAGFLLDRFWLPQRGDSVAVGEGPNAIRVATHERAPGVVLFRRSDGPRPALRLLYIVPEMPTGGVHKEALAAALAERERLLAPRRRAWRARASSAARARCDSLGCDTVRVVGPNFSGSALSLVRALARWLDAPARQESWVDLVSGTATSLDGALVADARAERIGLRTTINPDARLNAVLRDRVLPALDLDPQEVLLLVESSTAYGQAFEDTARLRSPGHTADTSFHVVRFPMAISSLRAEYARHPDAVQPARPLPGAPTAPRIPLTLADEAHPRERPPALSPLTPPTIDLEIAAIAQLLRDRRIRAVGLLASDVRDKLFLGEELRKRVRDVQLFTYESELLYSRLDYSPALRGMLVLSTYPPGAAPQPRSAGRRNWMMSPSDGALGIYNATLVALGSDERMRAYGAPARGSAPAPSDPPVWLAMVGAEGLAPINVFNGSLAGANQLTVAGRSPHVTQAPLPVGILPYSVVLGSAIAVGALALTSLRPRRVAAVPGRAPGSAAGSTPAETLAFSLCPPLEVGTLADEARRSWANAQLFETVESASLRLHRWLYRSLLLVSLLAVLTPALALQLCVDEPASIMVGLLAGVVYLGWAAVAIGLMEAFGVHVSTAPLAWRYTKPDPPVRPRRTCVYWVAEVGLRWVVVLLGLAYAGLVLRIGNRIAALHASEPEVFALLHARALDVSSGLSPWVPVALGALGFVAWCAWHRQRIVLLQAKSPFEAVCLRRSALPADDGPGASAFTRTSVLVARGVAGVRTRLFMLVPDARGAWLLLLLALGAVWLWWSFGRTAESVVFVASRRWPNEFEGILRLTVVSLLAATVWGVYRLVSVWLQLRDCLDEISELPLVTAFERLPPRVARLTRLTLFSPPSEHAIDAVATTLWGHLREIHEKRREDFARELHGKGLAAHVEMLMGGREGGGGARGEWELEVRRLELLASVLERFWRDEPTAVEIDEVAKALAKLDEESLGAGRPAAVSTSSRLRRSFTGPVRLWLRGAEEYAAVRVVEYVEWVLRHLRRLAGFLLLALLLMTALLSSYPFQPQSRAKLALVFVLAGTVASILLVMSQMNRDEVLSRITKTDPGRITWDKTFVLNIVTFAVLPLLALVSSEFPEVRTVLFAWVEPLLRMVTRA